MGQPQSVWRLLCRAAVIASVTAAIVANLSRSTDLTARVAAAEAANTLLDGLIARLRSSRLAMADAAQRYQEIVARIPWVPETVELDDDATVITATGAVGSALAGTTSVGGRAVEFSIATAEPPAGVYEARVRVGDVDVRLSWAVLSDGTSVGTQNSGGQRSAAPPLTLPGATFELDGVPHTAELR